MRFIIGYGGWLKPFIGLTLFFSILYIGFLKTVGLIIGLFLLYFFIFGESYSGQERVFGSSLAITWRRAIARLPWKKNSLENKLLSAIKDNDYDAVAQLLKQDVDVCVRDEYGHTLLMIAAINGNTEIVRLLIEDGAGVDQEDERSRTALIYAVLKNQREAVELLIEEGADVDHIDFEGLTALSHAMQQGNHEMANLLISHGAQLDLVNEDDW